MRIVTRPDFDGVVSAVLLYEVEKITETIRWVSLNEVQEGIKGIKKGDIISNLPFHENCSLWFDHHYSNRISRPFSGSFKLAPSAAGIIFEYYKHKFKKDYSELVKQTDRIDSADISIDEILDPTKNPYVLLASTISRKKTDEWYWNKIVSLLRDYSINDIIQDKEIADRCSKVIKTDSAYSELILKHTVIINDISYTDFRSLPRNPEGNRFLVHVLFPNTYANILVAYDIEDRDKFVIKVSHNIFNKTCKINIGKILSFYGGGGHYGAGSFRCSGLFVEKYLKELLNTLIINEEI